MIASDGIEKGGPDGPPFFCWKEHSKQLEIPSVSCPNSSVSMSRVSSMVGRGNAQARIGRNFDRRPICPRDFRPKINLSRRNSGPEKIFVIPGFDAGLSSLERQAIHLAWRRMTEDGCPGQAGARRSFFRGSGKALTPPSPRGRGGSVESSYCAGVTRQMILPTSSATRSAPALSSTTPAGRPFASPSSLKKPVSTSSAAPDGIPSVNGTKITL